MNAAQRRRLAMYGLSLHDYAELMRLCRSVCPLCLKPFGPVRPANIDHDHETWETTGLICGRENFDLLGHFGRDPAFYRRVAEYLESPPAARLEGERRRHRDAPPPPASPGTI